MNLFDILPSNYFQVFSGKNREIYADSLMTLFEMLQNDEFVINKQDFIKALKDKAKFLDNFTYEDEEFDMDSANDDLLVMNSLSSKASFICKRLEETGWIDVAMDPDTFEETIVLPTYSINFLRSIYNIISDEESPYLALVHSTYSELALEDEEKDELMYSTLVRCFENTKKLKVELVTLVHSIRIFQNRLGKVFDTNKVLHEHFDLYKEKVSDRYYHPLKTFDSVSRFKRPIIKILDSWLANKQIREKLILQASSSSLTNDKEKIENEIISKINYITDAYETLNTLISSIDKEHNQYTKSSTNKILYLNNTDKTIKGHLENIFKAYAKSVNEGRGLGKILSEMQNSLYFYEQGFIDAKSVTLPILRKYRENGEPLPIVDFNEASDLIMQNFLEETRNIYTDERVYEFMNSAFGDSQDLNIKDIPLLDYDAFVCLILATIKKDDDSCFYTIEEIDNTHVKNHGYIVPNFVFHRKENY